MPFTVTRDIIAPTVILTLSERIAASDIPVQWAAVETGSGIRDYDLDVSADGGASWTRLLTETQDTTYTFSGTLGVAYTFRVRATDNVNNTSTWVQAEAKTVVVKKYYSVAGQRVAVRSNGVVHYIHSDHLGSTSLTTDASGNVVAAQKYLPYGEVRWVTGTLPTDLTYTGQRSENGLGLMDYRARMYSSRLGRFVSADTLVPGVGSKSINRYMYVSGNPIRYNDPGGHQGGDTVDDRAKEYICAQDPTAPFCGSSGVLPPSYVHEIVAVFKDGSVTFIASGAGVAIDTNAILSHHHYVGYNGKRPIDQLESVVVLDATGTPIHSASIAKGEVSVAWDPELGGGLTLFVFEKDFWSSQDIALLGDADGLKRNTVVEQSVTAGAPAGLYYTRVIDPNFHAGNTRQVEFKALKVSPDRTIGGDSGAPIYYDGLVYGVNNQGYGEYGAITNISLIRCLTDKTFSQTDDGSKISHHCLESGHLGFIPLFS